MLVWLASLSSSHMDQAVLKVSQQWTMMMMMRPLGSALMCSPHPSVSVLQPHRLSPGVALLAHLVCPTCSRHPVQRISVVVLGKHWASLAVARSRWIRFFFKQQPWVVCLASSPRSSTASIPCMKQLLSTNSCPRSVS